MAKKLNKSFQKLKVPEESTTYNFQTCVQKKSLCYAFCLLLFPLGLLGYACFLRTMPMPFYIYKGCCSNGTDSPFFNDIRLATLASGLSQKDFTM